MLPAVPPVKFGPVQLLPEKAFCNCEKETLVTFLRAPWRLVMMISGYAPILTVVKAGIAVPVNGSFPLMLNASGWAVDVLPGYALTRSVPCRLARAAPKAGQVPAAFTPSPRPLSPSLPPPATELIRDR